MEKKNALAYKKFVMEAKEAMFRIMNEKDGLDKKELKRFKRKYNSERMKFLADALDDEILDNYINYDCDMCVVENYLFSVFGDVSKQCYDYEERQFLIIKDNFEIEYLLKLERDLKLAFLKIVLFGRHLYDSTTDLTKYVKVLYNRLDEVYGDVDVDESLMPESRFDFNFLKNELDNSKMLYAEKIVFINNRLFDFLQWQQQYDVFKVTGWDNGDSKYRLTNQYYPKFQMLCKIELERLETLKDKVEAPPKPLPKASVVVRPASKRKTDIMKIISAMYDNRMFANAEGKPHTNKQALMEAFGEFFGEDFTAYSALLSQAKDKPTDMFLKVFEDIKKSAKEYHEN